MKLKKENKGEKEVKGRGRKVAKEEGQRRKSKSEIFHNRSYVIHDTVLRGWGVTVFIIIIHTADFQLHYM